jgi:ferrochelatase
MRMQEPPGHHQEAMPTLLLVNLGTPTAPTAAAVSAYLDEFLSDPRVVQLPRWLWLPLLRKVILPRRSPVVAKKYAEIWLPGGSPLAVHTAALAAAVRARLPGWRVEHAMRYGAPSLAEAAVTLNSTISLLARSTFTWFLYPKNASGPLRVHRASRSLCARCSGVQFGGT